MQGLHQRNQIGDRANFLELLRRHLHTGRFLQLDHQVDRIDRVEIKVFLKLGVRVNVVAPGPIETEMLARFAGSNDQKANFAAGVPLKRLGRPEEIAEAILFVASDAASFISGASIPVNGGKSAL